MTPRPTIRSVCVYCGSKAGKDPLWSQTAAELGKRLAERGLTLVYGGGSVGLMGVIADAVLDAGGGVVGVIPQALATKELIHPRVDPMHIVQDMHARKALLADAADAFIAMPGGFGTLEELFEAITWAQLGMHAKPIALLNTAGYYDHLIAFIDHAVAAGFIKPRYRELFFVASDPAAMLDQLGQQHPPTVQGWMSPDQR